MQTRRVRSKREAERIAHAEQRERELQESLVHVRGTGPYHSLGVEQIGSESVCHLCSAVVQDRDVHTAWHTAMGQAMPV